jgi:DNA-binding MarR family transcriptional regulator
MNISDFDPHYQNEHIESKIVAALEKIAQVYRLLLWDVCKSREITPLQLQVLIFIYYHRQSYDTVSYLSKEFNLSRATISETIRILKEKKLIKKIPSSDDSRSFFIQLTDEGKKKAERNKWFTSHIHHSVSTLSESGKENLLDALLNIIHYLNKTGILQVQRMCFTCTYYQSKNSRHFCRLMNKQLQISDLRFDCPEHESIAHI